jgi:hypothetical protein
MNEPPAAARYVAGHMSEAEIAEFESQMLSRPDLAADVNVRQRIKAGLEVLEERQELSEIVSGVATRRRRVLALAAGIAVAAISASLIAWHQRGDRASHLLAIETINQSEDTPSFLLATIRGSGPPVIDLAEGAEFIELRVMVEGSGNFDVRLVPDAPGGIKAAPGGDGLLTVALRVAGLEDGAYYLSVWPAGRPEGEQRYPFELRRRR